MRTKIVAGNWKMNLNRTESIQLIKDLNKELENVSLDKNRVIVAPPYINLIPVLETVNNKVEVASQNMYFAKSGAFTGEISADMLKDVGIKTAIIGHSERREYFNETDAILKLKVDNALAEGMEVIFCFGEKLEEREANNHFKVVKSQLENALFHLDASNYKNIVLAYEPVWAIGTGKTASPEQAQEIHAFVREVLTKKYTNEVAESVSILYGGSVKPANAKEIFSKPDVDGGLIGGAALKAKDFTAIIEAM